MDGILAAAQAAGVQVLVIGMQAPGNYGPEYKASFDAIYPELAEAYGALYLESFFEGLGGAGTDPAALGAFMQGDGIHPNPQGVKRIVEGIGPKVLELIATVQK
jgi:acyl-CoA thioesterase-1